MSSARDRRLELAGRSIRGAGWAVVLAVLAASGAGLVGQTWHPANSAARAELTYSGDAVLGARLDAVTDGLAAMATDVESLASEAKSALAEVTNSDPKRLREALDRGSEAAAAIETAAARLRTSLADLPGEEPFAVVTYSHDMLVRRSTILAAVDAAAGLAANWEQVAARASEVANLSALITTHDQTVLDAAAKGRARAYRSAVSVLDDAILVLAELQSQRNRLIAGSGGTVLDEWIQRVGDYDRALRALYQALVDSDGNPNTLKVQRARQAERAAFQQLPADRRAVIVIISEVARGGLTDAVVAIEDASARIDDALADASPGASPSGALQPSPSP